MVQMAMVIDTQRCIGCHTCSIGCTMENNVPFGMIWNRILTEGGPYMDTPAGRYPNLKMNYLPVTCQHCENPHCVAVCPVKATYKREEDGIVIIDWDLCIGCRYCMAACPYNVRVFNWSKPKNVPSFKVGGAGVGDRMIGVVEKCTFCIHRLPKGLPPKCVEVCTGRARHFGDIDDPESTVSKLVRKYNAVRLIEDRGTRPSAYYLYEVGPGYEEGEP